MVDAVVSIVIERLGELLINEAQFLSGVKDQIEKAQSKLQCMSAFLQDANAFVRNGDERVRLLVVKVRDTSNDLEDVIETYIFKVALKKSGGVMSVLKRSVCIFRETIDVHRAGSKIEKISTNIDTWTSELQRYGVTKAMDKAADTCSSQVQEQTELRRAYSHFVENDVVGFDKDIEELVHRLTAEENPHRHRVISICGMGGLGKTTLARKVYQHPQVRSHFDCFVWVSISQQCVVPDVWKRILFGLVSPTPDKRQEILNMGDGEIAKELYNIQKQRKCLVLLDDIWTPLTWDRLKAAFPQDETDSKILLTTRVKNLALRVDRNGFIHEPQCLTDNESWQLFQKKSSYSGNDPTNNKRMEALGREMLKHCSGLPLAIVVLGGLLSMKHTIDEWEEMKINVMRYISKGREHGDSECHGVSWVLGLSYNELPFYLKPCFLYLARYPHHATIRVKELCLMLIAEGFISPRRNSTKTMEDIAYDYLSELVERSMVQVESWGLTGRMKTLRIHDVMRDLCVTKAQDDNFLHFIDLRNQVDEPLKPVSTVARRVAIYYDDDDRVDDFIHFVNNNNGSLRCLIVDTRGTAKQVLRHVFNSFFLLRNLNLSFSGNNTLKLPKEIGKLIHLRLLSINGNQLYLKKIHSSIGNLRCLQTLKLPLHSYRVPDVLWKLEHLRHLDLFIYGEPLQYDGDWLRRLRLPNIRNLQTLGGVSTECFDCNDFLQLRNLKKLKIGVGKNLGRIYHDPPTVTFDYLQHLQVFNKEWDMIDIVPMILSYPQILKLQLNGRIVRLPKHNQFSPKLIKLELHKCFLEDDPMPTLERLSNLRVLLLKIFSFEGSEMVCSKGGFPRLESLQIRYLKNLEEWKVEEGAMSSLCFLGIKDCWRLRRVSDGFKHITTLVQMKIEGMPSAFKERMEEGGDDFYNVHHVPSLIFIDCD